MVSSIYSTVYWPHGPHQQCSHGLTVPNSVKTAHLLLICNYGGCQKHNRLGILRERQNSVMHWLNTAIVKQLVGEFPCYMFLWLFTIHKSVSQVIPLSFILSRNESIHDISESHLLHFKYSCSTSVITDFKQLLRVPRKNKCSTLCMQDSINRLLRGEHLVCCSQEYFKKCKHRSSSCKSSILLGDFCFPLLQQPVGMFCGCRSRPSTVAAWTPLIFCNATFSYVWEIPTLLLYHC